MKKYNKANQNTLILGIILPILFFLISMNATYAYFSAKAEKIERAPTGILTVGFSSATSATINSNAITNSTKIIPGETLVINSAIENTGNIKIYAIIEFKIEAQKANQETKELIEQKYYSISDSSLIELVELDNGNFTTTAMTLESPNENKTSQYLQNFSISYNIDFNSFGNQYQNGILTYSLVAHAIQFDYIADATTATGILWDNLNN